MDDRSPFEGHESQDAVLADLFAGLISARTAAERTAILSLEDAWDDLGNNAEGSISVTWAIIMIAIRDFPDQSEKLAVLFINMADLPDVYDDNGKLLIIEDDERVWSDLPGLGMEFRDLWNFSFPEDSSKRAKAIEHWISVSTVAALLFRCGKEVFSSFDIFALWTMRSTLETPIDQAGDRRLDVFIPAAAVWISVAGREMYERNKIFPSGDTVGDPGKGGPLWDGQHGFCKARWQFWRKRFEELSKSDELSSQA